MNILHLYGRGLPNVGVIFIAPYNKESFSANIVRKAYRSAAIYWPAELGRSKNLSRPTVSIYRDRYISGDFVSDNPEQIINSNMFLTNRFYWDGDDFVKISDDGYFSIDNMRLASMSILAFYNKNEAYTLDKFQIDLLSYLQRQPYGSTSGELGDRSSLLQSLLDRNLVVLSNEDHRFRITDNGVAVINDLNDKLEFTDI